MHYENVTKEIKDDIIKCKESKVMRNRKVSQNHELQKGNKTTGNASVHGFLSLSVCALAAVGVLAGGIVTGSDREHKVYAASEAESTYDFSEGTDYELPTGIAGVVSGLSATPAEGSDIYRIGTSCEHVVVGQRVQRVGKSAEGIDLS